MSDEGPGYWDTIADTYTYDDQGDVPGRVVDRLFGSGFMRPEDCVLEVACGPGTYSFLIAPRARITVCMDSSPRMLDAMQEGMRSRGISNYERFEKDWSTYVPRKGYDVCFMALCPGFSEESSILRMEGAARRGCAVVSWERRDGCSVTKVVGEATGRRFESPVGSSGALEDWLSSHGRRFSAELFPTRAVQTEDLGHAVARMLTRAGMLGMDVSEEEVAEALAPYTEDGVVTMVMENVLKLVTWDCP